ncbi:thioredoxin domain-containing protein PLP3A-like [Phoenix dactylifera]|uniref:Thioredoxin domain-containing protein PLP3A-like n=1 Tax=Phoenix dactylifera TaxID=42345 RepID=A0A8B9AI04_PHODC|nr:thioredoxin domain-containing protein PLP3A-like [Phoenix dactylifera]
MEKIECVFLCFGNSVASTRFLLQDEFNIQTTQCDNCIINTHIDTKFIKLDAENAPFFVTKLAVKTLPCIILFKNGVAFDRLIGFQDLGSKDDFTMSALENLLKRKGIIDERKGGDNDEDADDDTDSYKHRNIRSSTIQDSDSD